MVKQDPVDFKEDKKPTLPSTSNLPLPNLSTVYRQESQPFTTYIPYQPLQQQQNQSHHSHPHPHPHQQQHHHSQQHQQLQVRQQIQNQSSTPSVIVFKQDKPKKNVVKKPGKPFVCTYPGCTWAFARHSDLNRHSKSHAPPQYQCPYWKNDPTCHRKEGSFNRLDVLKRHLRLIHYVKDKQPIGDVNPGDDPGWCRSCQCMFPNSKAFVEHCQECAQNTSPTEWIEIRKEGTSANPNQATFRVNLEQGKKAKNT
ncbi:Klf15 Krueppel-like factor 15 [Candida maltosa Xu316]